MESVRDQISSILTTINLRFKELTAGECAEYANVLASLLPNLLDAEAEAEGVCTMYQVTLLDDLVKEYSVAEAKLRMMATKEYQEFRKIRAIRIGVEETIRTLKTRVKVKMAEEHEFPGV